MAERLVVLVENDPILSERLRAVLSAHGFKVELVPDGNELLNSQQHKPLLIVLCIDPKRLGWAICNKVRRAPAYLGVPMIVTSQEATERDFDEHKKLRTRAEEYVLKPFSIDALLAKIDRLVGLKAASSDDGMSLDDAAIEEISLDDAVIEEEITTGSLSINTIKKEDAQLDEEMETAFAAIAPSSRSGQIAVGNDKTQSLHAPTAGKDPPKKGQADPTLLVAKPVTVTEAVTTRQKPLTAQTEVVTSRIKPALEETPAPIQVQTAPAVDAGERTRPLKLGTLSGVETLPVSERPASDRPLSERLAKDRAPNKAPEKQTEPTVSLDRTAEVLLQKEKLESELREAKLRAEKAEEQAAHWHEQRDQLASERDRLSRERDGLRQAEAQGPSPELLAERTRLLGERDQLTGERDGLRRKLELLATERDELQAGHEKLSAELSGLQSLASRAPTSTALDAAQAQLESARSDATDLRRQTTALREELEALQRAATAWHSERARLQSDLDDAKVAAARPAAPPASGGLLQSREVITLKEIIHKKEKEILDLRDTLDAKDRQVLDARDRAREQERHARDLDEKLLATEKESLSLHEKVEAMQHDREVWAEREKGLKGRLEDAQRKLARADEELQGTRKRIEGEVARAEAAIDDVRRRAEAQLADERQHADSALQHLAEERDAKERSLRDGHEQQITRERLAFAEEKRALEQKHAQTFASFEAQAEARIDQLAQRGELALTELRTAHAAELDDLRAQSQRAAAAAMARIEQGDADVAKAREEHKQALDSLRAQLTASLTAQHEGILARASAEAAELLASMTSQRDELRGERKKLEDRVSGLELRGGELLTRKQALEDSVATLRGRVSELESLEKTLQGTLSERDSALSKANRELASREEQLQGAYQRIVSDEEQRGRVRRALAITMEILQEPREAADSNVADSASTPPNG